MSTPFRVGTTHSADPGRPAIRRALFGVPAQRIPGEDVPLIALDRLTELCSGAIAGLKLGADTQPAGSPLIQVGDRGRSRARGMLVE
ncbi:MAG TPA: hypothetical protein VHW04_20110 [Solirubrobacteraceae bacterium]|jgi:hypothetical protein|nr:hypothetical protein [Solirubrobacteraceae bacterium]